MLTPGDIQQQRDERQRRRAEELNLAYRDVMSSGAGKLVMYDVLERISGLYGGTFPVGHVQAPDLVLAFNEGKRQVGIELQGELQRICPEGYVEMLMERVRDANAEDAQRRAEAVPRSTETSRK